MTVKLLTEDKVEAILPRLQAAAAAAPAVDPAKAHEVSQKMG